MEIDAILNGVASVGFPIVVTLLLLYFLEGYYIKEQEKTREVLNELKEAIITMSAMVQTVIKMEEKRDDI